MDPLSTKEAPAAKTGTVGTRPGICGLLLGASSHLELFYVMLWYHCLAIS
jgi:hypothetical protein